MSAVGPSADSLRGNRLPRRERPQSASPVPASKPGKSQRVVRIAVTAPDSRKMQTKPPRLHQVDPEILHREKEAPRVSRATAVGAGFT